MKQRNINLDVIRIVAMIMVVVLHTFKNFVERPDFFNTPLYWALLPLVIISNPAVIIFFILSGYLVLNKPRTIKGNLQRTLDRLVLPLFFFESLNLLHFYTKVLSWGSPFHYFVTTEFRRLISFPSSPLWFLYVLISFYLLNPLLQPLFTENKRKLAQYLTLLAFILAFAIAAAELPADRVGEIYTIFTSWLGFIAFYLYGGLLAKGWGISLKLSQWMGILGLAFASHLSLDHLVASMEANGQAIIPLLQWLMQLVWYAAPILVGISTVQILLMVNWKGLLRKAAHRDKWARLTAALASLSFGVYLIHPLIIDPVLRIWFGWWYEAVNLHPIVYNILNFVFVFGLSMLMTFLIGRVPHLRAIIGEPTKSRNVTL